MWSWSASAPSASRTSSNGSLSGVVFRSCVCDVCATTIAGASYMFNDRSFCCERHRMEAVLESEALEKLSGADSRGGEPGAVAPSLLRVSAG